ncbi:hypothetical protein B1A98_05215 [Bacillus badius]|nr:hypothetical protein B1A98_05215 [Bacillus badius]
MEAFPSLDRMEEMEPGVSRLSILLTLNLFCGQIGAFHAKVHERLLNSRKKGMVRENKGESF